MRDKEIKRKIVILGSGPAGLTAAIYASRAQLEPLVIDGPQPGGQLTITTDVENYPGYKNGIMGPVLMDEFREQATRFGTEITNLWIDKADLASRPFNLYGKESEDSDEITTVIRTDTLVIATGASAKWLGIPGEAPVPDGFGGAGVSACATCDGFFFRDRPIVVVGGGDTAMEEALFLTKFASKVKSVRLFNNQKNDETDFPTQGVFIAIGHKPNTEIFKGVLEMDEVGYLKTAGRTMKTNVPGVFACGDAQDSYYRQAVTAAGTGCMAAIDAERFLAETQHEVEKNTATNW
ncbi:MAG: FAD-dependent oxidoreductase [Acidobacteria bacterium]|nr:FAD-dependent oxidoreductase [Acidobacteriota bacterium]